LCSRLEGREELFLNQTQKKEDQLRGNQKINKRDYHIMQVMKTNGMIKYRSMEIKHRNKTTSADQRDQQLTCRLLYRLKVL
jgi:hypothetical protein